MTKSLIYLCLALGVMCNRQTVLGEEKSQLRALLLAREESIKSFQADIVRIESPSTEPERFIEAKLRVLDWIDKNNPQEDTSDARRMAASLRSGVTEERHFRCLVNETGHIRLERVPLPGHGGPYNRPDRLEVLVYAGTGWKSYLEATDDATGNRIGSLNVTREEREPSWYEIARGGGVKLSSVLRENLPDAVIGKRSTDLTALTWTEFLDLFPPEQCRVEMTVPPGGKEPRPTLHFESKPTRGRKLGSYLLEVWFAPEHGYALQALRGSVIEPGGEPGKWEHVPLEAVEWSKPVELDGGIVFFRKCHMRFYDPILVPDETQPSNVWAFKSYERFNWDFEFANVQINKPIDPALFDVQPIAGTNVIDEPKGFLYVVGNAGEELHKTAISERERRPPDGKEPLPAVSWRLALMIANVVALLALAVYWFVLRKRRAEHNP